MAAYIVGMIAGAVCMIAPLMYFAHINSCVAEILAENPDALEQASQAADKFVATTPTGLMWAVGIVGAVVFLLSAVMTAFTGVQRASTRKKTEKLTEQDLPEIEEPEL
jgi:hypothetical protein